MPDSKPQREPKSMFRKLIEGEITVEEYVEDVKRRVKESLRGR